MDLKTYMLRKLIWFPYLFLLMLVICYAEVPGHRNVVYSLLYPDYFQNRLLILFKRNHTTFQCFLLFNNVLLKKKFYFHLQNIIILLHDYDDISPSEHCVFVDGLGGFGWYCEERMTALCSVLCI